MQGVMPVWLVIMKSLDTKVDNSASYLDSFVEARNKWCSLLHKDQGTELTLIVLKHEFSVLKLNFSVAP